MQAEIEAAAEWWKNRLRSIDKDSGERGHDAIAFAFAATLPHPTEEMLEDFKQHLIAGLTDWLTGDTYRRRSWEEAIDRRNPNWGACCRAFGCDYHPDLVLYEAAHKVGINTLFFPWKTTMRINPGCVQVGDGYQAEFVTIYGEGVTACDR